MKNYLAIIFIILFELDAFPQHSDSDRTISSTYSNKDMRDSIPTIYDGYVLDSLRIVYNVIVQFHHPLAMLDKEVKVEKVSLIQMMISGFGKNSKKIMLYADSKFTPFQKYIWKICEDKLQEWYKHQPYNEYLYSRDEFTGKRVSFFGALHIINKQAE